MNFGKDIRIEEDMSEAVEGGAALAWRLLATLEGGSLLLATSALLAYTVRNKLVRTSRTHRNIRRVLVTNTTNLLGRELKRLLEARGCEVETLDLDNRTTNGSQEGSNGSQEGSNGSQEGSNGNQEGSNGSQEGSNVSNARQRKVDALVVIGAEPKAVADGLDGMTRLVSEDVYNNLKLLESLSYRVHRGGCMVWASCIGEGAPGAFSGAGEAFDTVLRASLQHVAKVSHCKPIWVGRCEGGEQAAESVVTALFTNDVISQQSRFSIRNAANRVGERLYRWLKIIT